MEQIIKKLVERFGKEKVIKSFTDLGAISMLEDHDCETGYYWSETLQKCVLDIGGHGE